MGSSNLRPIAAASITACLIAAGFLAIGRKPATQIAIRVGVDHAPPYYYIEKGQPVRGLAVDVLNEAARRRGIKLIWIPLPGIPLDDALEKRMAQMWPLLSETPERLRNFYFTDPWLEGDYVLVSMRDHPVLTPKDAAALVVVHARLKRAAMIADGIFSSSRRIVRNTREDAIAAVCKGEAVAAMMEESVVVDSILLHRPSACNGLDFRIARLAGTTFKLSIAAVPEVRPAAKALRAEINNLIADGFVGAKMDKWAPFSADGSRSIWAEQAADERGRFYRYCLILTLLFGAVLGVLAWRGHRLRQAAARAERGLREAQTRFAAFMDNSPVIAFIKSTDGRLLYVNQAWSQTFGISPDDAYKRSAHAFWPPSVSSILRSGDLAALEADAPRQMIQSIPVASGALRDLLVVKFPFINEKGEVFVGGTAIDVTERESALRELAVSEARYRELFEQNPLPAWVYDRDTLAFLTVNQAAIEHYGWTREDFLSGMTLPDVMAGEAVLDGTALDEAHGQPCAWRHQTKGGLPVSVETRTYEMEYQHRPARLTIIRDLTEQERTIEELRASEERWQLALRAAGDVLWDFDLITGVIFRSSRWQSMLGYEGAAGETREGFEALMHPDDRAHAPAALDDYLARRIPSFSVEYRVRHRDGTWRWIMDRGQAVWDERGRPIRMAGAQTDITDRKTAESALTLQAGTDPLTGAANRRVFDPAFAELVRTAHRTGEPLSVCVCDLDSFKNVNDSWGHAAGDSVLTAFAGILRENLSNRDLLARMGGDEFVLVLAGTSSANAHIRVERVRERLQAILFRSADGACFRVSSSFGIAELRKTHRDGDELIQEADRLLYGAKGSGRNRTATAAA